MEATHQGGKIFLHHRVENVVLVLDIPACALYGRQISNFGKEQSNAEAGRRSKKNHGSTLRSCRRASRIMCLQCKDGTFSVWHVLQWKDLIVIRVVVTNALGFKTAERTVNYCKLVNIVSVCDHMHMFFLVLQDSF